MSGPADNTGRCPTCSMMPHVHGCTPGKCGAPQSDLPPGKWVVTRRGARPAKAAELAGVVELRPTEPSLGPAANDNLLPVAPEHPLPWRWYGSSLLDARGRYLITRTEDPSACEPPDPYVRAVTERAGAMEQALRRMIERAFPRMADGELGRCIYCAAIGGPPQARHYPECPVAPAAALLAEIDAAKKAEGNG